MIKKGEVCPLSLDSLTSVPSEEEVSEYVSILKSIDWQTGLKALITLVVGIVLVKLVLRASERLLKKSKFPENLHAMAKTTLRFLLYLIVLLTVISELGIPVTSFVAVLSLLGLAVSLAMQDLLSNLAGGMIILGSHPYNVGDYVEYDSLAATVREIRMLHTRMETPDGKMVYVPNSKMSGGRLINYSETGRRRIELTVSASYRNTPEQVRFAIQDAMAHTEGILSDPAPLISLDSYGESAINYAIWVYVNSSDFLSVKFRLNERLYTSFAENGVEMTYPHMNVHLRQDA